MRVMVMVMMRIDGAGKDSEIHEIQAKSMLFLFNQSLNCPKIYIIVSHPPFSICLCSKSKLYGLLWLCQ